MGRSASRLGQLHLLDENDPHVRIAGVVFWEGNIDWDHVLVFVVTRYPSAFLFLYCVDAGFPVSMKSTGLPVRSESDP